MRAVRVTSDGPGVVEVDEPAGEGLLMEVSSSSICGTDLNFMGMGGLDFTFGHEFAGYVDGIAYAVEPTLSCGECDQCREGFTQRCVGTHSNLGIFSDGGLADRVRVPPQNLVPLPTGLSIDDACLVEPAAVAYHGVQRAGISAGERVVVLGGGSIGLLVAAALRRDGHQGDIEVRHRHQRAAAERLGAGEASGSYDVVIEAVGTDSGIARCAQLARPGGRVVLLGVFPQTLPVPGVATLVSELTWIGAMAYGRGTDGIRDVEHAAALLAADPEIARTLITHRFPLDDAAEAVRVAGDRASGAIKVSLHP
ncbi:MAG TPA: alcohol dehydrogenase catalytic domain-containing protein [Frankiaceae bacterium]|nr:alcohol dehydrogenase catalytic domain-containing protein [Frankiaceae bacterium]